MIDLRASTLGKSPAMMAMPTPAWQALAARWGVRLAVTRIAQPGPDAARAAGRTAAAHCLDQFGLADSPVGRADDGRAIWPDGLTGSISHRGGIAVAAVQLRSRISAIGIDLEHSGALPAADATLVLSSDEQRQVNSHPDPDALATLLWSVKEAAFKAWSTALGGLPNVDPAEIAVTPHHRPRIDLGGPDPKVATEFEVRAIGALTSRIGLIGPLYGSAHLANGWVLTIATARSKIR